MNCCTLNAFLFRWGYTAPNKTIHHFLLECPNHQLINQERFGDFQKSQVHRFYFREIQLETLLGINYYVTKSKNSF